MTAFGLPPRLGPCSTLISRLTGNLGTGTEKVCGLFAFYS